ncbi:hypothetical protein ACFTWH_08470 [Streptomyces sp. NPDC057011]|uniref:hypothetical protein n=1 Tax=unclassified Streptomyces TaxID=2593676 RepID=UPI003628322A
MNDFWARKAQERAEQQRQAEQEAMAAQLTYRNPNLGGWSQAAVEKRRAEVARNKAAEAAVGVGQSVGERMQREYALRAFQARGVDAATLEARPAAVYGDVS